MYIFKNAFISITRNKGRNILMAVIIIAIACACSITLAIRNSANSLVESYANKYEIQGKITMNRDNLMNDFMGENREDNIGKFNDIEQLTEEEINNYGNSVYVKKYYYTHNFRMNSTSLEKATSDLAFSESIGSTGPNGSNKKNIGDFTIIGYSSYDAMSEFISGKYTITEGSISEDFTSNTCVISNELATVNNIKVGDKIILVDPNDEAKTYELEVTGIYKENEAEDNSFSLFSNSANTIITNNTVASSITKDSDIDVTLDPTFILKNKDDIDGFKQELVDKGLSDYYTLSTNLDTINSETASVQNVSNFALTFLIITLLIGAVVLLVINMINVRERRYEIGVLRTIGMKKSLVIGQFVLELLIISVVSLLIGAGIGSMLSVPTANKLLENEINSATEGTNNIGQNFGKGDHIVGQITLNGVAKINQVDSIHAVVDMKVLFEMLGIGLLLTLISSTSAMISISRFSPITILKERS